MPGAGGQPPQRTTFRPPWVKDGPNPLPMPTAPWTLNSRRDSKPKTEEVPAFAQVTLKVGGVFRKRPLKYNNTYSFTMKISTQFYFLVLVF